MNGKKIGRRGLAALLLALCAALLCACMPLPETDSTAVQTEADTVIHFIDVGMGDAALIQTGDCNVLVDGGTQEAGDTVVDYLEQQGVTSLDAVIASHPHEDHIGGLPDVLETFEVDAIYMSDVAADTRIFEKLLDAIDEEGLTPQTPAVGETVELPNSDAVLTFLAPGEGADETYGSDPNAWSLVVRLDAGGCSTLFTGDTIQSVEKDITARSPALLDCDILKVAHHGSRTSSCAEFLAAVQPEYAVISYGEGNSYGLPDEEIFEDLAAYDTQIFETAMDGTVVLTMENGEVGVVE